MRFDPAMRKLGPDFGRGILFQHEAGAAIMRCPRCGVTNVHLRRRVVGPEDSPTIERTDTFMDPDLTCNCNRCLHRYRVEGGQVLPPLDPDDG